jgi:hypothetical protein
MSPEKKKPWYKNISTYVGIVGGIVALISGLFTLDNRYAKCQSVEQFKVDTTKTMQDVRVDMKIDRLNDRYDRLKDRKRDLETQSRYRPNDQSLKNDLNDVNKEIDQIRNQTIQLEQIQMKKY